MDAGRELDALVAEKVLGWSVDWSVPTYPTTDMKYLEPGDPLAHGLRTGNFPRYSTDIAAAWQVVEKLCHLKPLISYHPASASWMCIFDGEAGTPYQDYDAHAATAPLAICLAALETVGVEGTGPA